MFKAILIDDEVLSISLLETLLKEIGGVQIVATFTDPSEGLSNLTSMQADIVFLDIEMSGISGIEVAEKINFLSIKPEIVFVTAYDHYALDAFNVEALDYILKPLEITRLQKTINKLIKRNSPNKNESTKSVLQAQFLGSFQLKDQQGNLTKWRTRKVKELAAYLIYYNKPIHRQQIMEELWPNTEMDKAATLLHSTIYQLRKKFREFGFENAISYSGESYSLNVYVESDINVLQSSIKNKNIEVILDLYNVDFLSLDDYIWANQESIRIRKVVLQILEEVVFGNHFENYSTEIYYNTLKKLNQFEPWDERYILKMVEYLIYIGDKKTANDIIKQYKKIASMELGIEPMEVEFIAQLEKVLLEDYKK